MSQREVPHGLAIRSVLHSAQQHTAHFLPALGISASCVFGILLSIAAASNSPLKALLLTAASAVMPTAQHALRHMSLAHAVPEGVWADPSYLGHKVRIAQPIRVPWTEHTGGSLSTRLHGLPSAVSVGHLHGVWAAALHHPSGGASLQALPAIYYLRATVLSSGSVCWGWLFSC